MPILPQLFPHPPSLTHFIHLHFNLFSFPSPVFPLYFSLSSLCLFCAFSQKHLLLHYFSLFVSKFSEAHPSCSLILSYLILSYPLLYYLVLAPLHPLCSCCRISLSSSPCHHFPLSLPHLTFSHSLQLKDAILLELCCLCALNKHSSSFFLAVPLLLSPASAPSSKQCMTPVAVTVSSY